MLWDIQGAAISLYPVGKNLPSSVLIPAFNLMTKRRKDGGLRRKISGVQARGASFIHEPHCC